MTKGAIMRCDCGAALTHAYNKSAEAWRSRVWVCLRCGAVYRLMRVKEEVKEKVDE
jgi:hypothetical protein